MISFKNYTLFLHSFGIPVGSLATALRASNHCGRQSTLDREMKAAFHHTVVTGILQQSTKSNSCLLSTTSTKLSLMAQEGILHRL